MRFDLFGFYISNIYKVKSVWICSLTVEGKDFNDEDTIKNLFMVGKMQGKWFLEICGKHVFGPKEIIISN